MVLIKARLLSPSLDFLLNLRLFVSESLYINISVNKSRINLHSPRIQLHFFFHPNPLLRAVAPRKSFPIPIEREIIRDTAKLTHFLVHICGMWSYG